MNNLTGFTLRAIKETPVLNLIYRAYTEYKIGHNYRESHAPAVFAKINSENKWGGKESVSGKGSDFAQTQKIIKEIPLLLEKYKIKTLLDLPCGDHNWMKEINLTNVTYIGGDIVESLVTKNNLAYGSDKKKFLHIDIINDDLPEADLILVRDCFVHFSYENIIKALYNIKKNNIEYILTTTFTWTRSNYDITTGNWRPLNLFKKPFNFPKPKEIIVEGCTESGGQYFDKSLALWRIEDLVL